MSLKGKTAILFGAGAIASGYSTLFADEEMNLVIVSRGQSARDLAKKLEGRSNSRVLALNADASDFAQVKQVFDDTLHKFQQIDVIVNGSGGNSPDASAANLTQFIEMDPVAPLKMLNNNYVSKWYAMQQFMRYLSEAGHQGSVVNITSMSGLVPLSRGIHYAAAYAAVENLTGNMAYVFGHYGLGRVNNLAVGFTIGDQNRQLLLNDDGTLTPRGEEIISATALHRFLSTEELAPHVLYLADEAKSSAINGITLRVDGGYGVIGLAQTGYAPRVEK